MKHLALYISMAFFAAGILVGMSALWSMVAEAASQKSDVGVIAGIALVSIGVVFSVAGLYEGWKHITKYIHKKEEK